jgi:hypothetical protein
MTVPSRLRSLGYCRLSAEKERWLDFVFGEIKNVVSSAQMSSADAPSTNASKKRSQWIALETS